jgi:hypothetical protein
MSRGRAELRSNPAFAAWAPEELELVADVGDLIDLAEGTVLSRAGLPARQAFVIVAGRAVAEDGDPIEYGAGEVLCDIEPVTGEPARRGVRASTRLTVLVLSPLGLARLHAVQRQRAAVQETSPSPRPGTSA